MTELKIKVSDDVGRVIERFGGERLISELISERVADLFILKSLAEKSDLTEEEALELGSEVSKKLAKRYEKSFG